MQGNYDTQRASTFMHYSVSLLRSKWNGIDWRVREIRDSVLILGIFAAVWACTEWFDLAPKFFQFGADHADWEFDDLIFVFCVMSVVFAIYSFRRMKDPVSYTHLTLPTKR